jgi:hypothetical protein
MFTNYILLVIKPTQLRAVVFRNAFHPKFNMHASTGFSICKGVVLGLMTARKLTNFYKLTYYTGLRRLVGWARRQKEFKQYCP